MLRPLTDTREVRYDSIDLDDAGSAAWVVTTDDPVGLNPSNAPQVVRLALPAGTATQLTSFTRGTTKLSVGGDGATMERRWSDDGATMALIARDDPFGTNPDLGPELFVAAGDGNNLAQLTSLPADARIGDPWIADDGGRVVFLSPDDLVGGHPNGVEQLFAIEADGTMLRQLSTSTNAAGRSIWQPGTAGPSCPSAREARRR